MKDDESIVSMQTKFTHVVNKLKNLANTISNQYCADKVLKSLTKDWKPKVA